jgi:glucosyl-dolichyl phosphate glucuronosyltransferase
MTSIPIGAAFEMVTFSLVIPTCNRSESLRRLLASIGRMAIPHAAQVEVIVIDNGSVDGTAALLAEKGIRPCNVCFAALTEPRKGKASALNRGLAATTGDFFLVLDDDVVVDPDLVIRHLDGYRGGPFDALQGRVLPGLDSEGKPADPTRLREYNIPVIDYGNEYREIRGLTGTNMSFTREVFEKVGFFDPRLGPGAAGFSEDTEYSMRIRKAGFRIGYTPHAVVYHELDSRRYGSAYNRDVEYKKGVSRSIYRQDSILFRVMPDLLANCFRYCIYKMLRLTQKAYKTEGRIMKSWGYLMGKIQRRPKSNPTV